MSIAIFFSYLLPLLLLGFLISKNFFSLFFSFFVFYSFNPTNSNKNQHYFLLFSLSLTLYDSTNSNNKPLLFPSFPFITRLFYYLNFFYFIFFFLCILLPSILLIVIRIAIFSFFFLRFIFIPWTPYKMGILILFL